MKKKIALILLPAFIICAVCFLFAACMVEDDAGEELCRIKFYIEDGGDLYLEKNVDKGDRLILGAAWYKEPKKSGYYFCGWQYENGEDFDPSRAVTQDISLYAIWQLDKFSVCTNTDILGAGQTVTCGENNPDVYASEMCSYEFNSLVTAKVTAVHIGYEFEGWYEGEELMSTNETYSFPMPAKTLTLTAKFKVVEKYADFVFVSDSHSAKIKGYKGSETVVHIPDEVVEICDNAFDWMNNQKTPSESSMYIKEIILPQGLMTIGENAFTRCSSLKSISIPDSVVEIGAYAFAYCKNLESVVFPNTRDFSLSKIENGTFYSCTKLASLIIPRSVQSIGSSAFYRCHGLLEVIIPDSVLYIKSGAFYMCGKSDSPIVIRCLAEKQPAGWEDRWYQMISGTVEWGESEEYFAVNDVNFL